MLIAATEMNTRQEIDRLVESLQERPGSNSR
jgi:hypothetical protein